MTRRSTLAVVVTLCVLLTAAAGIAAELKIGDAAPEWKKLIGTDDREHSLSDYRKAKALVIVFTCNHCPVAVAYEDRLIAIAKDYRKKGVQVVAISVNEVEGDKLPGMKERAEQKKFNFPYLRDDSQQSAREYDAICTPHVFVLDGKRKVVYRGAVDDKMKAEDVKVRYLRDALDTTLAGKTPATTTTRPRGCSIKWAKK